MDGIHVADRSLLRGESIGKFGPRITVVTVVLNAVTVLEDAIKSIQNQKYENIEYIVIDGGSTDGTVELIHDYKHVISYWESEKDRGIYDAMNKALSLASGDWLLFVGADDELLVQLSDLVLKMTDRKAIYYGDVLFSETGEIYGGPFSRYELMQRNICHQCIFYPRSVYKTKFYSLAVGMQADYLYNIELWGNNIIFIYLRYTVSKFSIAGRSRGTSQEFERIKLAAIKNSFGVFYYALKLLRNMVVFMIKRAYGTLGVSRS